MSEQTPDIRATVLEALERSPMIARFNKQHFWDAHYVDIVWRHNGKEVREQADWLKTIWYSVKVKPTIADLEKAINSDAGKIEIKPDGSIQVVDEEAIAAAYARPSPPPSADLVGALEAIETAIVVFDARARQHAEWAHDNAGSPWPTKQKEVQDAEKDAAQYRKRAADLRSHLATLRAQPEALSEEIIPLDGKIAYLQRERDYHLAANRLNEALMVEAIIAALRRLAGQP